MMGLHSSSFTESSDQDLVYLCLDVVKSCPYLFLLYEYCKNGCRDHSAQLLFLVPPKGKSAISIQVVGYRVDCSRSTEIQRATCEIF